MIKIRNTVIAVGLATTLFTLVSCADSAAKGDHALHDHSSHDHQDQGQAHPGISEHPSANSQAEVAANLAAQKVDTLPFFNSEDFEPVWLDANAAELGAFHTIPEFAFTNQNGETVSSESYDDTIYVASFFFATCPGICSMMNERLLSVQEAIAEHEDVRILSHTITPEIDTVDVLHDYAATKGIDSSTWDLVTGPRDDLFEVAKQGYFASEDMGEIEAAGDFKHTESVFLIDRNGKIRGIYNGLARNALRNLVADIALLQREQPLS